MRIKLKQYEKAKGTVESAKEAQKIVDAWEKAVKGFGELNGKTISVVNVNGEKFSYEVE